MSHSPKQPRPTDKGVDPGSSEMNPEAKDINTPRWTFKWNPTSITLVVCSIVCILLILARWYAGVLPQLLFGHDLMVLLQGGWKWKWGIIPHRDFYSPFGALNFALVAWGCGLAGIAKALPAAVCLVAAGVLPLALYATFTRMKPLIAGLATVVIIAQVLTPHAIRFSAADWTYAGVYNRWAYAIFSIALLLATIPPFTPSKRKDLADGFIAMLCVAVSVLIKISYGLLLAMVFVAFAIIQRRQLAYYFAAAIAAFLSVVVVGLSLDWSFPNLLHDTSMAAHARAGLGVADFFSSALYLYPELATTLMLTGLCNFTLLDSDSKWLTLFRTFAIYACCAGCSVAIVASNSPLGNYREGPLLNICALLLFAIIYRNCDPSNNAPRFGKKPLAKFLPVVCIILALLLFFLIPSSNSPSLRPLFQFTSTSLLTGAAVICIAGWLLVLASNARQNTTIVVFGTAILALTVAPSVFRNLKSLEQGVRATANNQSLPRDQIFESGGLKGVQIKDTGGDPGGPTTYVGKINEGLELLRQQGESNSVITVLDFCNPFDVAREVKPAKGAPICWQLGFVYSDKVIPPASQVFEGVDAVLIAKQFGDGNQENLRVLFQHYGGYLDTNFVMSAQTQQWLLAKRKR